MAGKRIAGRLALTLLFLVATGCSDGPDADAGASMDATVDSGGGGADSGGADSGGADSGSGVCTPACEMGRDCCGDECVNQANDPRHCGGCGVACGTDELCTGGACIDRPCTTTCGGGEICCGTMCCGGGQICCDRQGPVGSEAACVDPDSRGTCPTGCAPLCMCAAPDTPIATPDGDRPISELQIGDLVYSVNDGAVVVVPIIEVHREPVSGHRVERVMLDNGVTLEVTGGHPTADGREFLDLRAGDWLDGTRVISVEEVDYMHPFTYDILPASDTGSYYAGGARIGSTLAR